MVLSYFDFAVIITLTLISLFARISNKKITNKPGCLIWGLLFGLTLPIISQKIEIDRVASEREILDNFTLLYTYFKFPIYWVLGGILIALISKDDENPNHSENR